MKSAVKFINSFEQTVCDIAASNGYSHVVCGHIHQPGIHNVETPHGPVQYLNSGDWIENLTALEYHCGKWTLYRYANDPVAQAVKVKTGRKDGERAKDLMEGLLRELYTKTPDIPAIPKPAA